MGRSVVQRLLLATTLIASCSAPVAPIAPASPASQPPASSAASPAVSATATIVASPSLTDTVTPLAHRLEAEIAVEGSPDWPLAAFGSIWVLAPDGPIRSAGGTAYLVRIDPATNRVIKQIPLADRLCQGIVASDDAIWVCAADAILRVDPTTNAITSTVPIKGTQAFYQPAFGGGMVWALGSRSFLSDSVIRLDPATEKTTSFPMSGPIGGLTYAFDALWLTRTGDGTIVRVDPATGDATVVASGLATPRVIAAGFGSLWVGLRGGQEDQAGSNEPQVARIDPATGRVLAELRVGGSPQLGVEVWAGEGGVLVRSTKPWLARIDPTTNEVVETIAADLSIQGPVTVGFGSIWTVNIERDVVYRIKP